MRISPVSSRAHVSAPMRERVAFESATGRVKNVPDGRAYPLR
jgi:hypothetical protein